MIPELLASNGTMLRERQRLGDPIDPPASTDSFLRWSFRRQPDPQCAFSTFDRSGLQVARRCSVSGRTDPVRAAPAKTIEHCLGVARHVSVGVIRQIVPLAVLDQRLDILRQRSLILSAVIRSDSKGFAEQRAVKLRSRESLQ